MFPATGSTMTAAISLGWRSKSRSTASRSLNGAVSVSATAPGVDAGRVGQAERRDPGARLHEQEVGVAVVAARELDDLRASGERAGEAKRAHRRLGPGADEADELDARHRRR